MRTSRALVILGLIFFSAVFFAQEDRAYIFGAQGYNGQCGQHEQGRTRRDESEGRPDQAVVDHGVRRERQMRAVLLDGRNRQQRDGRLDRSLRFCNRACELRGRVRIRRVASIDDVHRVENRQMHNRQRPRSHRRRRAGIPKRLQRDIVPIDHHVHSRDRAILEGFKPKWS